MLLAFHSLPLTSSKMSVSPPLATNTTKSSKTKVIAKRTGKVLLFLASPAIAITAAVGIAAVGITCAVYDVAITAPRRIITGKGKSALHYWTGKFNA